VRGDPGTSIGEILSSVPGQTLPPRDNPLYQLSCPAPIVWPNQTLAARSLMEWAAESELRLATWTFYTSVEEMHDDNYQDPDPCRAAEVKDLVPLRFFATNGSYKVEPENLADILTAEAIIRDKGKSSYSSPATRKFQRMESRSPVARRSQK
jgi:hypothetical protein